MASWGPGTHLPLIAASSKYSHVINKLAGVRGTFSVGIKALKVACCLFTQSKVPRLQKEAAKRKMVQCSIYTWTRT